MAVLPPTTEAEKAAASKQETKQKEQIQVKKDKNRYLDAGYPDAAAASLDSIPVHLWCCRRAGKSGGGGQGSLKYEQSALGRSSQVLV